ncbi:MAG: NYN domain-containing protein [Defluviitaleaceae bacterium]|nr:NYN domain-containing protein [Defluviitaleaceae bacterium]
MKSSGSGVRHYDVLLVDGYNIIHDWKNLADLAKISLEFARDKLVNLLSNFRGFRDIDIIVVFDAHKIRHGSEKIEKHGGITVIYTAEFETADSYIERATARLMAEIKRFRVAVATGDLVEQVIIMGRGAIRLSARDLLEDIQTAEAEIRRKIQLDRPIKKNSLLDNLDPKTASLLEAMRQRKDL